MLTSDFDLMLFLLHIFSISNHKIQSNALSNHDLLKNAHLYRRRGL